MYVEQYVVDPDGRLRIALVWIPDDMPNKSFQDQTNENIVVINLDKDSLENIINFDLN